MKWLSLIIILGLGVGCTSETPKEEVLSLQDLDVEISLNTADLKELHLTLDAYKADVNSGKSSIKRLIKSKKILSKIMRDMRREIKAANDVDKPALRLQFKQLKLKRIAVSKAIKKERRKMRQTISKIRLVNKEVRIFVARAEELKNQQHQNYIELEKAIAKLQDLPKAVGKVAENRNQ